MRLSMDNANKVVTIFGGSGFVGTQIVQVLARKGYRIRVAVRRPDLAGHVKPLGGVGQVVPIQANVRNPDSVARAVADMPVLAEYLLPLVKLGGRALAQKSASAPVERRHACSRPSWPPVQTRSRAASRSSARTCFLCVPRTAR